MPKQPQDHKPAQDATTYTFHHKGKTFSIPVGAAAYEKAVKQLPGRFLRDAYMDGEDGEMRMGFALIELVADKDAQDALYDMPAPEMMDHVKAWFSRKPSEEDASLGESSSSPE